MPAMTLEYKTAEQAEEEAAAAKLQSMKRGADARAKVDTMKAIGVSPVWAACKANDPAKLAEVLPSATAEELGLVDPEAGTVVAMCIAGAKYECAKQLIAFDAVLGVDAGELGVWQQIQKDMLPIPEGEEGEEKDVTSEEYSAELAASALPSMDATSAGYLIKQILKIGVYMGSREEVDAESMAFDTQVGAKSGYGVTLSAAKTIGADGESVPTGDVYAGMYAAGLREGVGALRTKDGTLYAGEWKGGKRHGYGTMTYKDGGKYMGKWAYGKRHGTGTFAYANGDTYTGKWHAGTKHGEGKYAAVGAQCVYEGEWKHGTLKASKVVLLSAESAAYYGAFDKHQRPTGAGAFAYGNGVTLGGEYSAPLVEEAEGDEPPAVLPSVWAGGACGSVETTTDATYKKEYTTVPPTINVIIAGAPASGKGTQCEKIVAKYGLVHVSTGDMLRAAAEDPDSADGALAKEKMEAGELVPDELITRLLVARLDSDEVREKGWLLDGYPRTAAQAAEMEKYFLLPSKAVLLDVPEEVLVKRVTGRRLDPETGTIYHMETKLPYKLDEEGNPCTAVDEEGNPKEGEYAMDEEVMGRLTQRADDTEEALKTRLVTFGENRDAIASYFASIATSVDGNRDPEAIYGDIDTFLSS